MDKKQQNWLHVLFIAIAVIGLLINVGIVFLIGVILEIWHLWRIYQQKKGPSSKANKKAAHKDQAAASHGHAETHQKAHTQEHHQAREAGGANPTAKPETSSHEREQVGKPDAFSQKSDEHDQK